MEPVFSVKTVLQARSPKHSAPPACSPPRECRSKRQRTSIAMLCLQHFKDSAEWHFKFLYAKVFFQPGKASRILYCHIFCFPAEASAKDNISSESTIKTRHDKTKQNKDIRTVSARLQRGNSLWKTCSSRQYFFVPTSAVSDSLEIINKERKERSKDSDKLWTVGRMKS